MHEWALAEGVVATALEAADEAGLQQITRLVVTLGALQQIEEELFARAIAQILPQADARLAGVDLDLRVEPALCRCRSCRREFGFADAGGALAGDAAEAVHFLPELAHAYLRCPDCDSPDFEVAGGRGVWLERVEGIR